MRKLTDLVSSYITFCSDLHLEKKQVKVYPNNKPWVTSELRKVITDKYKSYGSDNYQGKQKEANSKIKEVKSRYKDKVENMFKTEI